MPPFQQVSIACIQEDVNQHTQHQDNYSAIQTLWMIKFHFQRRLEHSPMATPPFPRSVPWRVTQLQSFINTDVEVSSVFAWGPGILTVIRYLQFKDLETVTRNTLLFPPESFQVIAYQYPGWIQHQEHQLRLWEAGVLPLASGRGHCAKTKTPQSQVCSDLPFGFWMSLH